MNIILLSYRFVYLSIFNFFKFLLLPGTTIDQEDAAGFMHPSDCCVGNTLEGGGDGAEPDRDYVSNAEEMTPEEWGRGKCSDRGYALKTEPKELLDEVNVRCERKTEIRNALNR